MCGIAGLFAKEGEAADPRVLAAMAGAVVHRGPDGEGAWTENNVGLAHRRLSIIDPAGGAQPMVSVDGRYVIVSNGEIYNYRELKKELGGEYPFKTRSDTEALLAAFWKWGTSCMERLDGIFAFAVWDREQRTLFLGRDPFGVKPLYWAEGGGKLLFGSEIKSILAAEPSLARLSPKHLHSALTWRYTPSPATLLENVRKLRPGHLLVVKGGQAREVRYTRPPIPAKGSAGEHETEEELARRLESAVKGQMVSDVPVGILLSGGVDSSLVAALAARHAPGMTAFTVGFQGGHAANEVVPARAVARHFGLRHETLEAAPDHFLPVLEKMVWHLEEPVATSSAVPFFMLCETVRRTHKVVLSGQGADEQWAGYARHMAEGFVSALGPVLAFTKMEALAKVLPGGEKLRRAFSSLGEPDVLERYAKERFLFDDVRRKELLRSAFPADLSHLRYYGEDVAGRDALSAHLYWDMRTQLADDLLLYTDKLSMAYGVEVRVPLLDPALAGFVESLPSRFKLNGLKRKYLFKKVAARFLPPAVLNRRKIGFETPVEAWFKKELRGTVRDMLCGPGARIAPLFRAGALESLVERHVAGTEDLSKQLFLLLSIELWMRRFKVSV